MNILFFIGNGFDLNVGLNTEYKDVLHSYSTEKTKDNAVIKFFKKSINEDFKTWGKFEEKMGFYTNEIQHKESQIETFLDYSNCIYDFKKYLKHYLETEESKVQYDEEKKIAKTFDKSLFDFAECLNCDPKIVKDIIDKDIINFYFINFNYTSVFDKCLDVYRKSDMFPFEKITKDMFMFTRFNKLGKVNHIHGTLKNNMILGVNDLKQIKNTGFHGLERVKNFIKPVANEELGNQRNIDVMNLISDADIYCIYGMSLGDTDKKWWIELAKQLKSFPNKHLIIYAYNKSHDNSLSEHTLEEIDYHKNIFFKHLRFTDLGKDNLEKKLKNNIRVRINRDIFKMKLVEPVEFFIEPFTF